MRSENSKKEIIMLATQPHADLAPWTPTPTVLPEEWVTLAKNLAQQAKGSSHSYVLNVRYDAERVGSQLQTWGLPWQVVMAGFLWEYGREQICLAHLNDVEQVLGHIAEVNRYVRYVKDDNLAPLLTPPYDDLGALLVALAIYYQALRMLQEHSNGHPYAEGTQLQVERIERIGRTLINMTTRLGMWLLKRDIEDLSEQLRNPQRFKEASREHRRILEEDTSVLEDTRRLLIDTYQQVTHEPVYVTWLACSISGMKRRKQDAHTTATSRKTQLIGLDLATFDIVVPTLQDCYKAFGVLGQLGRIQDRVTDLIADPKANGCSYIALGLALESQSEADTHVCQIQIATHWMQAINWYGCLHPDCYPLYVKRSLKIEGELLSLIEHLWVSKEGKVFQAIGKSLMGSTTYSETRTPILVYAKNRRPIFLPKEATALDFAYVLDSEIGEHAVEAIVNDRKAPLHRVLDAGDIVEIRTSKQVQADVSWLQEELASIPKVRQQIEESLNRRFLDRRGSNLLRQELERYHYMLSADALEEELRLLVKHHNFGTSQAYLQRLSEMDEPPYTPKWAAQEILRQIDERNELSAVAMGRHSWVPIVDGQPLRENKFYQQQRYCRYCQPAYPVDIKIMGRLRQRSGELVVHKETCPYLMDRPGSPKSSLLTMSWQLQPPAFRVTLFIIAQNRRGLVLDIVRLLRRHQCELFAIDAKATNFGEARIHFTIETHTDKEVLDIWRALEKIEGITRIDIDPVATPNSIRDRLQKQRHHSTDKTTVPLVWEEGSATIEALRSVLLENSFDISRPATGKMFFGRDDETEIMQRELCEGKQGKALVLHGPRRIGKSSLCKNFLERNIQPPFWSVLFSLHNARQHNEETILMQLAEKVCKEFSGQLHHLAPAWDDYHDSDPQVRFRHIFQECLARVPGARLVLVLEEFGGALDSFKERILEYRFFTFWKELVAEFSQLSLVLILPMSAHNALTSKKLASAFNFVQSLPISFLDANSAQQLLVDPLHEQNIEIRPTTVALALRLTAGNPYYMTLIGQQLIHYLNSEIRQQQQHITDADLRLVVGQIVEGDFHQNFDFLARELQSGIERSILETIVELTSQTKQTKVQLKKIAAELHLQTYAARRHLDRLRIGLILDESGPNSNPYYSFRIDLVRRWLMCNRWFFSSPSQK